MNRLESFMVKVKTGARGRETVPRVRINDREYELENLEGSTSSGEVLKGSYNPFVNVQQFVLQGPEEGVWDIEDTEITYSVRGREPYTVHLGPVSLGAHADMNMW